MSRKIIVFFVVAAVCGCCLLEVANAEGRGGGRKFVSGFGGVYREGDLLVRFAPKGDGKQRSVPEKSQEFETVRTYQTHQELRSSLSMKTAWLRQCVFELKQENESLRAELAQIKQAVGLQ